MAKESRYIVIAESPSIPHSTGFRQVCERIAPGGTLRVASFRQSRSSRCFFVVLRFRPVARIHEYSHPDRESLISPPPAFSSDAFARTSPLCRDFRNSLLQFLKVPEEKDNAFARAFAAPVIDLLTQVLERSLRTAFFTRRLLALRSGDKYSACR